ncbi:MAG: FGGY family carbohydrate kinase [Eubacteriales bacterium]
MVSYVISIDVGTQGTKTGLLRDDGIFIAEAFLPSRLIQPEANVVEQVADEIVDSCIQTIRSVIDQSGVDSNNIVSLAIDGQMAGIIGINQSGHAVTPYDSWLDQRCGAYWEFLRGLGEKKIISLTGCPITYAHGPKILWWKHERPETYANIARFVLPAAYAVMRLCNLNAEEAFIDYTYLHFSGFADTHNRSWSEDLLHAAGIDPAKMPKIVKPFDIIGRISVEMAEATHLKAGTPVAAGCGDTAASIFGAGVTKPGVLVDVAGTASVFACAVDKFVPDTANKTLLFAPSVIDGLYTPMAYINGGGLCIKWYKDQILSAGSAMVTYNELEEEARALPPGSENLLFVPHFAGRVCPNDGMVRGSWLGLTLRHTRGHLYRSIMEGIGYEYHLYLDILKQSIPELETKQILAVGGGAKSTLMRQIKSDILGIPMATISRTDTGVLGTGIIAGYAVGLFDSLENTVEKFVRPIATNHPDTNATKSYERFCTAYSDNFSALKSIYQTLLL